MTKKIILLLALLSFYPPPIQAEDGAVAIIVNPANAVDSLSLNELKRIFKIETGFWPNGSRVILLLRGDQCSEQEIILRRVYQMSAAELKRFWIQKLYQGAISEVPGNLHSDAAVKTYVGAVPNAIGFIKPSQIDESIKVLEIDGKLPHEKGYPLK